MERAEFYECVRSSVRHYLPLGFQKLPVLIHETELAGQKTALFTLKNERAMPVLSLERYCKKIEAGENPEQMVMQLAVDYAKQLFRERKTSRICQR